MCLHRHSNTTPATIRQDSWLLLEYRYRSGTQHNRNRQQHCMIVCHRGCRRSLSATGPIAAAKSGLNAPFQRLISAFKKFRLLVGLLFPWPDCVLFATPVPLSRAPVLLTVILIGIALAVMTDNAVANAPISSAILFIFLFSNPKFSARELRLGIRVAHQRYREQSVENVLPHDLDVFLCNKR